MIILPVCMSILIFTDPVELFLIRVLVEQPFCLLTALDDPGQNFLLTRRFS